jgi:hypothetical protein
MAITSSKTNDNICGNLRMKTYSFTLSSVSEGEIDCGLRKVVNAWSSNGDVNIVINSNNGTVDSDPGDIYLVGSANATGYITVIGK